MPELTIESLISEAALFAEYETQHNEPTLYGINDGKKVGTYLEQKFTGVLAGNYSFEIGNSASGIDLPGLNVDLKTTSIKQPQSSCPFRTARQKIYGLGYHLLVFVYEKIDDAEQQTSCLNMQHTIFVEKELTGDFQTSSGVLNILANNGTIEDILSYFADRNLPLDDIEANKLAEEIISGPPSIGYLTISNALQWRLNYKRVIEQAGAVGGLHRVY